MRTTLLPVSVFLAAVSASLLVPRESTFDEESYEDHIQRLCFPTNSSGGYDLNAPCNKLFDIQARCFYGNNIYDNIDNGTQSGSSADEPQMRSPKEQQKCICGSGFWEYVDGYVALFTGLQSMSVDACCELDG
jgi:hypothetical protein